MKTIILCGGRGTRLAEETGIRPKPMVEIGGRPILWHIMSIYAAGGCKDFVIACGYKGEMIKDYFRSFLFHDSDMTINLQKGTIDLQRNRAPDWEVALLDTGIDSQTGGRLKRCQRAVEGETFMATYGDGVGSIDVAALIKFHRSHGKLATVTAVRPPARFGELVFAGDGVKEFNEKPQAGEGWINGGYFVFEPEVFDYLDSDACVLERGPLQRLSSEGQLMAYRHPGFWQPMDTLREKEQLEGFWQTGHAPWKVWD